MQQADRAKLVEREAALHRWSLAHASVDSDSDSDSDRGSGNVHAAASEPANGAAWHMVAGDASFRRYFRLVVNARSFIAMDAPPEQESVATFTRVAGLMRAARLRVPAIYAEDTAMGFLLLEDFGDHMVREELAADRGKQLFDWILPTLGRMAGCETTGLPLFDAAAMQRELDLFTDWYLARHCQFEPGAAQRQRWQSFCEQIIEASLAQPQHFVHRDFHSCNLHRVDDGEPGIIDFQDAVLGPASYDLASWLWDRYISWPRASLEGWIEQARPLLAPLLETAHWQQCCDWMGLQRNLKIIGIFARLNYRDGKSEYLELLPRFASYVRDILPRYSAFKPVQNDLIDWLKPCGAP